MFQWQQWCILMHIVPYCTLSPFFPQHVPRFPKALAGRCFGRGQLQQLGLHVAGHRDPCSSVFHVVPSFLRPWIKRKEYWTKTSKTSLDSPVFCQSFSCSLDSLVEISSRTSWMAPSSGSPLSRGCTDPLSSTRVGAQIRPCGWSIPWGWPMIWRILEDIGRLWIDISWHNTIYSMILYIYIYYINYIL